MGNRVITVTAESAAQEFFAERALAPFGEFRFERITWERFAVEDLAKSGARLVILMVESDRDSGMRAFACLKQQEGSSFVLAVLPGSPDQELFNSAAEVCGDVLMNPFRPDEFQQRALRLLRRGSNDPETVRDRLIEETAFGKLVGEDPGFLSQVAQVRACSENDFPVLITGETGTGKEVFARAIHQSGPRCRRPFIPLDCGAIPDHLFENELFGHSRGAFTDAHKDQKGLVALATGGTLLLDEVDSLSLAAQAKLLRLIQERTYRPLGSDTFLRADVKIIAATNGDLEMAVERKQFRSDLYYRLNVLRLHLPALRDRKGDIAVLACHFLRTEQVLGRRGFSSEAMDLLRSYAWPGNIRELLNVVQRAIVFSRDPEIDADSIPLPRPAECCREPATFREARQSTIREFERRFIVQLLEKHSGNVTRAAREAGKDRRVFGRLAKKYGFGHQSTSAGA